MLHQNAPDFFRCYAGAARHACRPPPQLRQPPPAAPPLHAGLASHAAAAAPKGFGCYAPNCQTCQTFRPYQCSICEPCCCCGGGCMRAWVVIAHGVDCTWEIAASSHTTLPVPVCDLPHPLPHPHPSTPAGKPGYEKNRYNVCNRCTRKGQTSDAWCAGQGRTQSGIHGRQQCLRCQRVAAARWQGHMCQCRQLVATVLNAAAPCIAANPFC